jgi:hypothetical protein
MRAAELLKRVTRRYRIVVLFAGMATASILALLFSKPATASISIKLLSYQFYEKGWVAHLRIMNTAKTPFRWGAFGPEGWLEIKTESGWKKYRQLGTLNWLHPQQILRPGESRELGLGIRGQESQWRVRYQMRAASPQERALAGLRGKWGDRLAGLCQRLISDKPGPAMEFVSDVFDSSNFVQAHKADASREIDFESISSLPSAPVL